MSYVGHLREIGSASIGRAVTDTLYVSPEGAGTNGKTWAGAFTTIQAALDAASTDADECTLILISPHTSNYNINTTGDPTWTGNYILQGTKRNWAKVMNAHASATSVMKFTGKVAVQDLNINLGTANNGLILTHGGSRVVRGQFVGEDLTSAKTCIWLDHASTGKHAKVIDVDIHGNVTYCRGLLVDNFARSRFRDIRIHSCLEGIQIVGATSDHNSFENIDIGDCTHANGIGINIDAGNEQHFSDITFHHNTKNVDDEVGDHLWGGIYGQFPIEILPNDLDGTTFTTGDAASGIEADWGTAIAFIAADELEGPYRIVGVHVEPADTDWFELRFSADSGATYSDRVLFKDAKRAGSGAPSGTEYIFNAKSEFYCEARNESGGDNVNVWVEIQKI